MRGLLDGIGRWSDRSDYTSRDLGVFRIVYAVVSLVFMPNYYWISRFDPAFYHPPPGPYTLLSSFPPAWFFAVLDVAVAGALALLLIGWKTLPVSFFLSAALVLGDGFAYSFGKIDHSILFVLTPIFMGLAGWGNNASVDARAHHETPCQINHWALRGFAVAVGTAFVTAAVAKAVGGWLNPSTQATYAYVVQRVERGRSEWLAPWAARVDVPGLWEALDWSTIMLEGGLLLLAISWRSWRLGLCLAVTFHVGVLLTLNIDFWMNVVAYGAFVRWSRFPSLLLRPPGELLTRLSFPTVLCLAFAGASLAFATTHLWGPLTEPLGWVPVLLALLLVLGWCSTLLRTRGPAREVTRSVR